MDLRLFTVEEMPGHEFFSTIVGDTLWSLAASQPRGDPALPVAAALMTNGKPAVVITLIQQTIDAAGKGHACLWGHGYYSTEHNPMPASAGLFLRALRKRLAGLDVGFGVYGATPAANAVFQRLGMPHVGRAARFVLPTGARSFVRRHFPGVLAPLAAGPVGVMLRTWGAWALRRLKPQAKRYERTDLASWDGDCSIVASLPADEVRVHRDASFQRWKEAFARTSAKDALLPAFALSTDGRPAGFVNLRITTEKRIGGRGYTDARVCRLMDAVTVDAAPALLYHVIERAREHRCDFLEIITSDPAMRAACERCRLIASSGYELYLDPVPGWPEEMLDMARWRLAAIEADPAF